ncbi:hypothetical protein D9M68_718130 [compost metagenome]
MISMLIAMSASMNRIIRLSTKPTRLSTGLQVDMPASVCFHSMNPISTMPDGVTEVMPDACSPSLCSDLMIEVANSGPFLSSHR